LNVADRSGHPGNIISHAMVATAGVASPADARGACAAWAALMDPGNAPLSVAIEQARGTCVVYRLQGAGPRGSDVIAKRIGGSAVERTVYEDVLPGIPVRAARFLGTQAHGSSEWIFLGDAGGAPYNWATAAHREAAGRWLGEMHMATAGAIGVQRLPRRDSGYWAEHLSHTRDLVLALERHRQTPAAAGIIASLEGIRSQWRAVERLCGLIPDTLVHGDLVPKNMRVIEVDGRAEMLPLDWGSAGHGTAAIDLAYVDARAYWRAVRVRWPELAIEDATQLSGVGRLFRDLLLISWLVDGDGASEPGFDEKLGFYERWIRVELRRIRAVHQ
jgi:hypothetical protein